MAAAAAARQPLVLGMAADDSSGGDPNEIVGKRIIVTGDVNGGYLRTCISNEAGKFRRLLGTMSPPDDGDEAEIYVEVRRQHEMGISFLLGAVIRSLHSHLLVALCRIALLSLSISSQHLCYFHASTHLLFIFSHS